MGKRRVLRRDGGFTLIELLVAITLLGLILAMIFGGLRFGTRAWERADEAIDATSEVQAVQSFLRRVLGQASGVTAANGEDNEGVAFVGERERLAFVTSMPAHLGFAGFYRLTFRLERKPEGASLIAEWRPYERETIALSDSAAVEERVLIEGIDDLAFGYFGSPEPERPPDWHDLWLEATTLPSLVRLELSFAQEDKRSWPVLVAVLPLANAATVTPDALSGIEPVR
ncbi:MAG: prepilin-type N-terminal cleavage/methylation domain-containing protein [Proteobacteria bacterium]|nr:prepilin-type N-terminal cleavage/methylation domain-containing protein [Pseudomonadota bacterium]